MRPLHLASGLFVFKKNPYEMDGDKLEGYCLKDKKKVEMKDPQPITMKNGKPATVGTCPICGTKIYRIGKST